MSDPQKSSTCQATDPTVPTRRHDAPRRCATARRLRRRADRRRGAATQQVAAPPSPSPGSARSSQRPWRADAAVGLERGDRHRQRAEGEAGGGGQRLERAGPVPSARSTAPSGAVGLGRGSAARRRRRRVAAARWRPARRRRRGPRRPPRRAAGWCRPRPPTAPSPGTASTGRSRAQRLLDGVHRATGAGRLDDHHRIGERGDDAVAGREAPRLRRGAERALGQQRPARGDLLPQRAVAPAGRRRRARWRRPRPAAAPPPASSAPRWAAPSMPRARPDTTCTPHGAQVGAELAGQVEAVAGAPAGADDRHPWARRARRRAAVGEHDRRRLEVVDQRCRGTPGRPAR